MKLRMIGLGSLLIISVGIFSLAFPSIRVAKAQNEGASAGSTGGKIEGTWRVRVTQRDCQSGAEIKQFPAMLTFAAGGTLTGTTTAFPVALRSPDHGIWSYEGNQHYHAVSEAFIFNPAGAWVSTQRITQEIELGSNSDTLNSDASVQFFDTAGNAISSGCATAVATRMQ